MAKYGEPGNKTREILLTFDDGPNRINTPKLLDILDENEIKAVFFVTGSNVEQSWAASILERTLKAGHTVGNHTYSHANLKKLDKEKIKDEIQRTHDLICGCGSSGCKVFRPPYGSVNQTVFEIIAELGYSNLLWSVDPEDWKYKQDGEWVSKAIEQIKSREDSIVLMHDIHKTTVENVPLLIKRIREIPNTVFSNFS